MTERRRRARRRLPSLLLMQALVVAVALSVVVAPATAARRDRAEAVIASALEYLGRPYRLGGEGPKALDCSGLVFRAFSDAGQLKAVGDARMRAVGYLRWFTRQGLATGDESQAVRGDLIVYADGEHIGIYLGRGEVVSALTTTGITVHRLHGINWPFSHVLKVDWSMGRRPILPADDGEVDDQSTGEGEDDGILGLATGSLHLRTAPDPASDAIGVVSRGSDFTVVGAGRSPSGSLWLNVETSSGATGWIWSQFTQLPEGADPESVADAEEEVDAEAGADGEEVADGEEQPLGVATGSLNLRAEPAPDADIVGVVSRGAPFRILGGAHSPGGWLWLNVETESGATGWLWSHWTDYPAELVENDEDFAADPGDPVAD